MRNGEDEPSARPQDTPDLAHRARHPVDGDVVEQEYSDGEIEQAVVKRRQIDRVADGELDAERVRRFSDSRCRDHAFADVDTCDRGCATPAQLARDVAFAATGIEDGRPGDRLAQ